jgi:hypothetical protein
MAYALKMEYKAFAPAMQEPAADMVERFGDNMSNAAEVINDRRKASVPDDGTFNTKVAGPSSRGFAPMIDSTFVSKHEHTATAIKQLQQSKLAKSFSKWNLALDYIFGTVNGVVAARFKDLVQNKKVNWAAGVADSVLRVTGDRVRGRGVSAIAAYSLVADGRVMSMLRPADIWLGGVPYNIARDGERPSVKSAVQSRLVQAALMIFASGFDAATILAQNTITASLLTGLADAAKADPFVPVIIPDVNVCSFVHDIVTAEFYLHVRVGLS